MDHNQYTISHFALGSVMSRSFSVWLKNFVPFTLLMLMVYTPLFIGVWVMLTGEVTEESLAAVGLVLLPATLLLNIAGTGALTFGVVQQLRGQHAGMGECIAVGVQRLFPALLVGVLAGLCIALGFVLLIVPGIFAVTVLWVAVPVSVIERPGIVASLTRSADLTRGFRWSVLGILVVLAVINKVTGKVVEVVFGSNLETMDDIRAYVLVLVALSAVVGSLSSVASAVAYHDLRVAKEGANTDDLVRVFD